MRLMNFHKAAVLALIGIAGATSQATAQLRVAATTPDLASVAREIGGNRVNVVALAKPTEDPHFVDAKPSFIVTLNRADALIEGALSSSWDGCPRCWRTLGTGKSTLAPPVASSPPRESDCSRFRRASTAQKET